jgi:hypothetical protein
MDHIGIDVHKNESQVCILGERGELREQRIRTIPERFAAVLGERPRARILLEASTESEWVARCLEQLGHEVIVAGERPSSRSPRRPTHAPTSPRARRGGGPGPGCSRACSGSTSWCVTAAAGRGGSWAR